MFAAPNIIRPWPGFRNLVFDARKNISGSNNDVLGCVMNPEGTKMVLGLDPSNGDLENWTMSTPYDVTTLSEVSQIAGSGDFPSVSSFDADGSNVYYVDANRSPGAVYRSSTATPYVYRLGNSEQVLTTALGFPTYDSIGIKWTDNGYTLIAYAIYGNDVTICTVTTPYTFTGVTIVSSVSSAIFPGKCTSLNIFTYNGVRFFLTSGRHPEDNNRNKFWIIPAETGIVKQDSSLFEPSEAIALEDVPSDGSFDDSKGQAFSTTTPDGSRIIAVQGNGVAAGYKWLQRA